MVGNTESERAVFIVDGSLHVAILVVLIGLLIRYIQGVSRHEHGFSSNNFTSRGVVISASIAILILPTISDMLLGIDKNPGGFGKSPQQTNAHLTKGNPAIKPAYMTIYWLHDYEQFLSYIILAIFTVAILRPIHTWVWALVIVFSVVSGVTADVIAKHIPMIEEKTVIELVALIIGILVQLFVFMATVWGEARAYFIRFWYLALFIVHVIIIATSLDVIKIPTEFQIEEKWKTLVGYLIMDMFRAAYLFFVCWACPVPKYDPTERPAGALRTPERRTVIKSEEDTELITIEDAPAPPPETPRTSLSTPVIIPQTPTPRKPPSTPLVTPQTPTPRKPSSASMVIPQTSTPDSPAFSLEGASPQFSLQGTSPSTPTSPFVPPGTPTTPTPLVMTPTSTPLVTPTTVRPRLRPRIVFPSTTPSPAKKIPPPPSTPPPSTLPPKLTATPKKASKPDETKKEVNSEFF